MPEPHPLQYKSSHPDDHLKWICGLANAQGGQIYSGETFWLSQKRMADLFEVDRPGLYIAHPDVKEEEIVTYPYKGEKFTIDDDGIIPILPHESPFDDNLQERIAKLDARCVGEDKIKK